LHKPTRKVKHNTSGISHSFDPASVIDSESTLKTSTTCYSDQQLPIPEIKLCSLIVRSAANKVLTVNDFIINNHIDICALTETWLQEKDYTALNDLLPTGYSIFQKHRINRKGGGLAIVFRQSLQLKEMDIETFTADTKLSQFELLLCSVTGKNAKFYLAVVYRSSPSKPIFFQISDLFFFTNKYIK